MLIGLVFVILSPLVAQLMQLAVSRRREFLADAEGARLTRGDLARALEMAEGRLLRVTLR